VRIEGGGELEDAAEEGAESRGAGGDDADVELESGDLVRIGTRLIVVRNSRGEEGGEWEAVGCFSIR
jgi:hypothetical protein